MPNQTVKNDLKAKMIKLPPNEFFSPKTTNQLKRSCNYWPLSLCKIFKKFLGTIQSYEDVPFLGKKWPICHEIFFFGTNHYYYFHLPIGTFHCAKLKKKFLQQNQSYEDRQFMGPKLPKR